MDAKASDDQGDFRLTFDKACRGAPFSGGTLNQATPWEREESSLNTTRRSNRLDRVKFVEGSFKGGGDVTADSLLLNLFGVFHDDSRFSPYAGLGIGCGPYQASGLEVIGHPMGSGSAVVFAYQFGGGVDIALTDYLALDLGYRFFSSTRPVFTEVNGDNIEMDYPSHSAVLGLRLGF